MRAIFLLIIVTVEVLVTVGGVSYILFAGGLTGAVEILLPMAISITGGDLVSRIRNGWDYIKIFPKLVCLTILFRPLRISFANLIRIQVQNRYLLIKSRRFPHFQPVGGVFKFYDIDLKRRFHLKDDNAFQTQNSDELRLRFPSWATWEVFSFLNWFDSRLGRELGPHREFVEELLDTKILPTSAFQKPNFKFIRKVVPAIKFSTHLQIYELFLFEIYEFIPDQNQLQFLDNLCKNPPPELTFLDAEQIERDGYDKQNPIKIGTQTKHIL